jgi:molybdate transport system regulatory protein
LLKQKANFWIEKDGKVVLSLWRIRLLESVRDTGSISAAASQMGISYRRAWDKIHECEERLGVRLVETQTGGEGGGGSSLTPEAVDYIRPVPGTFIAGLDDTGRPEISREFSRTLHKPLSTIFMAPDVGV